MQDLNDKITGSLLTAAEWNEVPSEIQNVIEALGQGLSSGDLNQLGKSIAGYVANGTFYTESGIADAYVLSKIGSKQTATAYSDGFSTNFLAGNVNTGASTINVAGLGVKNILLAGGVALAAGDISGRMELVFDNPNDRFELLNPKITGKVLEFKSTIEMKADPGVKVGMRAETLGYFAADDTGDGKYSTISGTGTANDANIIAHDTLNLSFVLGVGDKVFLKKFGCKLDGIIDDFAPLQIAYDFAKVLSREVHIGVGKLGFGTTLALSAGPVTFVGERDAPWQQGSTLPSSSMIWLGGATPMITVANADNNFIGFGVENHGTATDFVELIAGAIRTVFKNQSWVNGSGHTRFTRSMVRSSGNRIGYSEFDHIVCLGPAPRMIDIDGLGIGAGITPFTIKGRSLIESNSGNAMTVIHVKDEKLDMVTIDDSTFNQQDGELIIIDTTDTPVSRTIDVLNFIGCEWDTNLSSAGDRMMKLTNVGSLVMDGGTFNGGGTPTSLVEIINSTVASFNNNNVKSINGGFFNNNTLSQINVGDNEFDITNTKGVVQGSYTGVIDMTFAASVILLGHLAPSNVHKVFEVVPSSGSGFTIVFENGGNLGYVTPGQIVTVRVKNIFGAIAATNFSSSFKLAGATVTPTVGNSFSYTFAFDVSKFTEISRSAVETPN